MKAFLVALLLAVTTSVVQAHHQSWGAVTKSARCGWLEGDNVRDVTNLTTFCSRWVPAILHVRGVTAHREYLWIDASPELAAALLDNDATTEAILKDWLGKWRAITASRTAFVSVLRGHVEIARAGTAMSGDFVTIR